MTLSHNQQHVRASQTTWTASDGAARCWNGWMGRQERNHISRPAGRRRTMGISRHRSHITLTDVVAWTILILLTLCVTADAGAEGEPYVRRSRRGRHGQVEEILLDRSAPPETLSVRLRRRQDLFETPPTSTTSISLQRPSFDPTATRLTSVAVSLTTRDSSTSSTATSSGSDSTTSSSTPVVDSPLPKPFDSGFGTNYTQQSCPSFLRSLASNETFTSCLPFSLLLQVSMIEHSLKTPWADRLSRIPFPFFTPPVNIIPSLKPWTQRATSSFRPVAPSWRPLLAIYSMTKTAVKTIVDKIRSWGRPTTV